jgi:hypothetical protein
MVVGMTTLQERSRTRCVANWVSVNQTGEQGKRSKQKARGRYHVFWRLLIERHSQSTH